MLEVSSPLPQQLGRLGESAVLMYLVSWERGEVSDHYETRGKKLNGDEVIVRCAYFCSTKVLVLHQSPWFLSCLAS